jgi:hypothetical protein
LNANPNITQVQTYNISQVSGGTVIRGQNFTINVTVSDIDLNVQSVWVQIWSGIVGGPILLIQYLQNLLGNLWGTTIQTNYSWPTGVVNYTVYANDTWNAIVSVNGTINISRLIPFVNFVILNTTNPATNDTLQNLTVYANATSQE